MKDHIWAAVAIFPFVTISIIFTPILFRHNDLNVPSFFVQVVEAVKPSQSNTGPTSAGDCINYTPSTRTITVSCSSARLTDIDNTLHDSNILSKQSPADGVWYLNANLVIAKGATFHIDSTDTKWLKISSKVRRSSSDGSSSSSSIRPAYWIDVVVQ